MNKHVWIRDLFSWLDRWVSSLPAVSGGSGENQIIRLDLLVSFTWHFTEQWQVATTMEPLCLVVDSPVLASSLDMSPDTVQVCCGCSEPRRLRLVRQRRYV